MAMFPVDAPKKRVVKDLKILGFDVVGDPRIKGSTLRSICTQTGITRDEFLAAYKQA